MAKVGIVGGGIGGLLSASLLKKRGHEVEVFERSNNLGGCSGSYQRDGRVYNIGATTLPGCLENYSIHKIFQILGMPFSEKILNPSIVIKHKNLIVKRSLGLDETIEEVERAFPLKGHRFFWKEVFRVTKYLLRDHPLLLDRCKPLHSVKTFTFLLPLAKYYFSPALSALESFYDSSLPQKYLDFISAQVRITAQAELEEVSALTMFLALGYPFTGITSPEKGMGSFLQNYFNGFPVYLNTPVQNITRFSKGYLLRTKEGEEFYEGIWLNLKIEFQQGMPVFYTD